MSARGPSQVRVSGPLAPHADGFRAALDAQGFSPWSQMFYLHLLADVSRWLDQRGLDASGLTDANASAFRQDRRSRGRARFRGTQGLALLLSFLRDAGAAPQPAPAGTGDETEALVAGFADYLAGERGLRPQTIALYSSAARLFLGSLPPGGDGILTGLTADAIRSFVIAESSRRGTGSLKNQVTAVRSMLRFLHLRGLIPDPLDRAAPAAAGWHRPPLTRKIRPEDVDAILASCDRDTHAGRRDYAILMLLARLGLRAGEAAAARGTRRADAAPGRCRGSDRGLLPERQAAGRGQRNAVPARPRPLRPAVILGGRPSRGPVLPAGRAAAGQRPSAPARRRDRDAAGRGAPARDQPAASPPA